MDVKISYGFWQIMSKYNEQHANEVLEWIAESVPEEAANFKTNGDMDNLYEVLKDGTLLCKYGLPKCLVNAFSHLFFKIYQFICLF